MSGSRALLVFAKTPKPGKVKTRLLAAVSAEVAAALHEGCIADTLRLVRKIRGGDVVVFSAGGGRLFCQPGEEGRKRGRFCGVPHPRKRNLGAAWEPGFKSVFLGYCLRG